MITVRQLLFSAGISLLLGCSNTKQSKTSDDQKIDISLIQINDVYEIAPLNAGKEGGLARVGTLKKQYLQKNPNTLLLIAGDFLSPSVYNSLKYNGQNIRGAQMVDALNAAGLDIAVFGNHEFDIKENELQSRINESKFQWISANAFQNTKSGIKPFAKITGLDTSWIPKYIIREFTDKDGTKAKVGFIGVVLPFNKAPYVKYETPANDIVKAIYNQIKDSCDAVVAITHQTMEEDLALAKQLPQLAAILGGHEHDQRFEQSGPVYVAKAMANAKSAYVTELHINKQSKKVTATPVLEVINEKIALDQSVTEVVEKWINIANDNFSKLGFDANKVVIEKGEDLDGRESAIRSSYTNLGVLVVESAKAAWPEAQAAIVNSGSIRVDDVLSMPITQYDIIRTMPYGGSVKLIDIKGDLLIKILNQGVANKGEGGFLQLSKSISRPDNIWLIDKKEIQNDSFYKIAITDFLLTGGEANLGYLLPTNPAISKVTEPTTPAQSDIRKAFIEFVTK